MLHPLHLAVREHAPEQMSRLLALGVNVDDFDEDGNTALMLALSLNQNPYYFRPLVDAGASLIAINHAGMNPLMVALDRCHHSCIEAVLEWLRDAGDAPYVDEALQSGRLALLYAIYINDLNKAAAILANGTDVNAPRRHGETPTMLAAAMGHATMLRLLLARGAEIHAVADGGASALTMATESACAECVGVLLEAGADANKVGRFGQTPLIEAAFAGDAPEVVRILIEHGADISATDDLRGDALSMAAWQGNAGIVRVLLEYGAGEDRVALQRAYRACFIDNGWNCAPILLAAGATIGLREAVAMQDTDRILQLLESEDVDVNAYGDERASLLVDAIWSYCDTNIIKALLDHGANVNAIDGKGRTAITTVTSTNNEPVLQILVEAGADVNIIGEFGYTPLMCYAGRGSAEAVRIVLQHGADVNGQSDKGCTALMTAAARGDVGIMNVMIGSGADLQLRDSHGRTALFHAAMRGRDATVALLLQNGAIANDRDNAGNSALRFAKAWKFDSIAELLVNAGAAGL